MQTGKNKKYIVVMASAILFTATVSVGVCLAVLTKTVESRANNFTFVTATIDLEEPEWETEDKTVEPGKVLSKDPQVTNTGKNDLYVYLEVKIPQDTVDVANVPDNGKIQTDVLTTLLTTHACVEECVHGEVFENYQYSENSPAFNDYYWTKIESVSETEDTDKDGYLVAVYAYHSRLQPDQTTEPLFCKVQFDERIIEGELSDFNMPITAYAIQADYLEEDVVGTGSTELEKIIKAYETAAGQ